jgi:hypothetical protein
MSMEPRDLLVVLEERFHKNRARHPDLKWEGVRERLDSNPGKLKSLRAMEDSGGEPDLIGVDAKTGEYLYCDCSPEAPTGRRSLCYDSEALRSRKENKPAGSALEMAAEMGIEILTEDEYRRLQEVGEFDRKTSCWVRTPAGIRKLGGALFCDRRYDHVFVYHNGAESYYSVRGFRGLLRI